MESTNATQSNRIAYIGILRVAACFFIVLLHCAMAQYTNSSAGVLEASETEITISRILQLVSNWAVPCFVMISGALLLDNDRSIGYKKIFTRYIPRMLAAIVVFSIMFSLIDSARSGEFAWSAVISGLKDAALDGSWVHMWYLYMMVAVYLMLPIFRKITNSADKRDILYILALYFVFLVLVDLAVNGLGYSFAMRDVNEVTSSEIASRLTDLNSPAFYIFTSKVWPLYLFLGYSLHKGYLKIKPAVSLTMVIIGAAAIAVLVTVGRFTDNADVKTVCGVLTTNNSSVLFVLLSVGIYSLAMKLGSPRAKISARLLLSIDRCTFGIYLLHLIPIKIIMSDLLINPLDFGGIFGVLVFAVLDFAVCFAAVWLLKKIPLVRRIL